MAQPIFYYVDHTSRFEHNSGIQRCVRLLAGALIDFGQPLIPVVWDRSRSCFAQPTQKALSHLARWNGPAIDVWHPWRDPSASPKGWLLIVELVCGPRNPSAVQLRAAAPCLQLAWLFHDAIPWQQALRAGCPEAPGAVAHTKYMNAMALDAHVFCNSRTSRVDLICFLAEYGNHSLKGLTSRISPLPLAENFPAPRLAAPSNKVSDPLCFLMVSTLEQRKNHLGLIKALAWLHSQGVQNWQLELIGWAADPAIIDMLKRARILGLPVKWFGGVSDERLRDAYANADICLYPSFQEGFGLPVAESLWHRRPCLCSNVGAIAELAQSGGCLTVNTHRWQAIAVGLKQLLEKPQLREKLGQDLEQRCYRTWTDVAQELLSELTRAI